MSERIGRYLTALKYAIPRRKTSLYQIRSNDDAILGHVAWYTAWRQYTFDPAEGTTFNADCLADLKAFLDRCNGKGV